MFRTKTNKIDAGIIARFCLTMKPEIGFQVYPNREQSVNKYWKDFEDYGLKSGMTIWILALMTLGTTLLFCETLPITRQF